ncbi:MAG: Sir2 family NAD-dependent protein deacetylase [Hyphomicrobiales bacterium]
MSAIVDLAEGRRRLAEAIAGAARVVFFTGAGMSTESGIPDFRSPNGYWATRKPIMFDDFVTSEAARIEDWERRYTMRDQLAACEPNAGHVEIARLVASGKASHVITQNIDGLHQRAGVPAEKVIELHGNATFATCLDCGLRHELDDLRPAFEATGEPTLCRSCGGLVKAAVISFGQAMPSGPMRDAEAATLAADLFVVLGSSLVVYPAAGFPVLARRNGAALVIVNREETPIDEKADLVVHGEIGALLAGIAGH